MTHTIKIICTRLSDGSRVYDVQLNDIRFPCPTEQDAHALSEIIRGGLVRHALDEVRSSHFELTYEHA